MESIYSVGWDNQKKKLIAFYQAVLDEKVILMCGIFGIIGPLKNFKNSLKALAKNANKGKRFSGLCFLANGKVNIFRADFSISLNY